MVSTFTPLVPSARAWILVRRAGIGRADRLNLAGWTAAESSDLRGSAVTNPYTKQIVFSPKVAARQSARDVHYVAQHEVGHALDYIHGSPHLLLAADLNLTPASAQEALAEAVAYWARHSAQERWWILSSIAWHVKTSVRWRYAWLHVRNKRTREIADMLVRGEGKGGGTFYRWAGWQIVRL